MKRKRESSLSVGFVIFFHALCFSGDPTSQAILDAFLLGRALAETTNERLGAALGEALSEVSKRQAE